MNIRPVTEYYESTGWEIRCAGGGCDERLPSRSSEAMAHVIALASGWRMVYEQRFSGVVGRLHCAACVRKKRGKSL